MTSSTLDAVLCRSPQCGQSLRALMTAYPAPSSNGCHSVVSNEANTRPSSEMRVFVHSNSNASFMCDMGPVDPMSSGEDCREPIPILFERPIMAMHATRSIAPRTRHGAVIPVETFRVVWNRRWVIPSTRYDRALLATRVDGVVGNASLAELGRTESNRHLCHVKAV